MASRKKRSRLWRCPVCGLHEGLCVCASLPRLAIPERILIVQHAREAPKTTNTGRLVHRLLENSLLTFYGGRGEPFDVAPFQHAEADYAMLYPRDDARLLAPDSCLPQEGRVQAFILLDGTWSQAAKMSRRVPGVKDMPCYALPSGKPGRWAVRHSGDPRRLSTIEACARLLALLGYSLEADIMEQAFETVMQRVLAMRGKHVNAIIP